MDALNFVDVAKLINRIGTVSIPELPTEEEKGQWAAHDSAVQIGGITGALKIIYLFADATTDGTRRARSLCKPDLKSGIQVIYADSLMARNRGVIESFKDRAASVLGLTDYFRSFIRTQTESYVRKIRALDFKDYVDPDIKVSGGFSRKVPNPAFSYLVDPDLKSSQFSGTLGVLLGEPGQGKTFMSRYLADACAAKGTIPIYVHSEQWSRMQQDELSSLWKTIVHSFRYFESPIGWVDGAEEQFLRVALRTGLFRIIFDGFDEFVLWNKGTIDAIETIRNLQALSDATGTRILVSSRTSFWETEIADEEGIGARPRHIFKIQPFDDNNARKYFKRRFPTEDQKQRDAFELFRQLSNRVGTQSTGFVGRGFFLFLIADLVARGFTADTLQFDGRTVFKWMAEALCEREKRRQNLPISAREQLEAISNFAEFVVRGEPSNSDTLSLVIQAASSLSPREADSLVAPSGKIKDHPLLHRDTVTGQWGFVQEQIRYNLLADRVIALCAGTGQANELSNLIKSRRFDLQLQSDVAFAMVEQIFEGRTPVAAELEFGRIIGALLQARDQVSGGEDNAAAFAAAVALLATNRLHGKGAAHLDRTQSLRSMFPKGQLSGLFFTGTLARFDFSESVFEDCTFHQVAWANCEFSAKTRFVRCKFIGGSITACSDFGLSAISDTCNIDSEARAVLDAEAIRAGRRNYTQDDLRSDLTCLAIKFVPKDGLGTKSVEERSLGRGTISNSIHKDEVIDAFKRQVVELHVLSGGGHGYHAREEAKSSLMHFATNGIYTGKLADAFEELSAKLLKGRQ